MASESAFSTRRRVLDSFRSPLSHTIEESLICTQNWIRVSSSPLDMGSILEDLKLLNLLVQVCIYSALCYHNMNMLVVNVNYL